MTTGTLASPTSPTAPLLKLVRTMVSNGPKHQISIISRFLTPSAFHTSWTSMTLLKVRCQKQLDQWESFSDELEISF